MVDRLNSGGPIAFLVVLLGIVLIVGIGGMFVLFATYFGEILRMIRFRIGMPESIDPEDEPDPPRCHHCGFMLKPVGCRWIDDSGTPQSPSNAKWFCDRHDELMYYSESIGKNPVYTELL